MSSTFVGGLGKESGTAKSRVSCYDRVMDVFIPRHERKPRGFAFFRFKHRKIVDVTWSGGWCTFPGVESESRACDKSGKFQAYKVEGYSEEDISQYESGFYHVG